MALGGTSYAAVRLPAASVGTVQLKDGAVTSSKVKAHSLNTGLFAPGTMLRGARGPAGRQGPIGPQGPTGAQGPSGSGPVTTTVRSDTCQPTGMGSGTGVGCGVAVSCPAGAQILGGGFEMTKDTAPNADTILESAPYKAGQSLGLPGSGFTGFATDGWFVYSDGSTPVTAYAICS